MPKSVGQLHPQMGTGSRCGFRAARVLAKAGATNERVLLQDLRNSALIIIHRRRAPCRWTMGAEVGLAPRGVAPRDFGCRGRGGEGVGCSGLGREVLVAKFGPHPARVSAGSASLRETLFPPWRALASWRSVGRRMAKNEPFGWQKRVPLRGDRGLSGVSSGEVGNDGWLWPDLIDPWPDSIGRTAGPGCGIPGAMRKAGRQERPIM